MAKESEIVTFFEDDVVMPNIPGKGLRLGSYSGQLSAFGWHDIVAPIELRGTGSTDPTWARIGTTNFYAYKFAIGKYVWQVYHVPHDIVPGSDIHFHAHHIPGASNDAGYVTWEFEWMYAKGFNQAAFDPAHATSPRVNSGVHYAAGPCGLVAYQHMVTETAAITIPGMTEPDGLIYVRLGRVANQTSPLNSASADIFLLTADVHYQSTGIPTKQKAPNFYAL